jgi:hypothetical protein
MILNFKTAPIWLLVGHAALAASNEILFGIRADVSCLGFHSARNDVNRRLPVFLPMRR